jgi:hypothetical protein
MEAGIIWPLTAVGGVVGRVIRGFGLETGLILAGVVPLAAALGTGLRPALVMGRMPAEKEPAWKVVARRVGGATVLLVVAVIAVVALDDEYEAFA